MSKVPFFSSRGLLECALQVQGLDVGCDVGNKQPPEFLGTLGSLTAPRCLGQRTFQIRD